MNKPHKSVKLRKGNLFDYLNQRRNDILGVNLSIESIKFSNKARNPSFNPEDGIPPLDQVTISGPDLPIYYTTDGSDPDTNSDSITSSPTTITLTGLPLTLKARGSVNDLLLGDIISSDYERNPLIEINPDENMDLELGVDDIRWVEMRFLEEEYEENMDLELGVEDIRWEEITPIEPEQEENMGIELGLDGIRWEQIDIIET